MKNIKFQFEATPDGNMLWVDTNEVFAKAIVEVPEGASEDYGYINLKTALIEALGNREMAFPYDGQEEHLASDAFVEGLDVDVTYEKTVYEIKKYSGESKHEPEKGRYFKEVESDGDAELIATYDTFEEAMEAFKSNKDYVTDCRFFESNGIYRVSTYVIEESIINEDGNYAANGCDIVKIAKEEY